MSGEKWSSAEAYKTKKVEMPPMLKVLLDQIGISDKIMPGLIFDEDMVVTALQKLPESKKEELTQELENFVPLISENKEQAEIEYETADKNLTEKLKADGIFTEDDQDWEENPSAWPVYLQREYQDVDELRREYELLERVENITLMLLSTIPSLKQE